MKKILWLSRHEMTQEQYADLTLSGKKSPTSKVVG